MFIFTTLLLTFYSGEYIFLSALIFTADGPLKYWIFSDKADDIRALYPPQTDNRDNMVQIEQDAIFDCPTRRLLQSGRGEIPAGYKNLAYKYNNHETNTVLT